MRALGIIFSNIHDNNVPELAQHRTLGSIPFGGRYRLIDFPLSNMVNSGIDTIGVITKSNYQSLMDHIGSGKDWDLARKNGGIIILPPFGDTSNDRLYTSRLEALKGIMGFLWRADEEYVVMTDCDNVCRIDYNAVIRSHAERNADITVVYRKHAAAECSENKVIAFDLDGEDRVTNIRYEETFSESGNMSMNMFVMKKVTLQNLLLDAISHNAKHFTEDILAKNLKRLKICGYRHDGYYVGITSLLAYYEHTLELLDETVRSDLFGDRSVFTKVRDSAPTKYGAGAIVKNSLIADGCMIEGEVENSVLFRGVKIARGTVVKNSILMQNTMTGENVTLNCIITDKNVVIRDKRTLSGSENHPFYISKGNMI